MVFIYRSLVIIHVRSFYILIAFIIIGHHRFTDRRSPLLYVRYLLVTFRSLFSFVSFRSLLSLLFSISLVSLFSIIPRFS